jgi:hypothetical protein
MSLSLTNSDVKFDTGALRHAAKLLSSLIQSSVTMPVPLYQKHMIIDIRSFISPNNHLNGLELVSGKTKSLLCAQYTVWDVIYNHLDALHSFDQQVLLVYTVLIKALINLFSTQSAGKSSML